MRIAQETFKRAIEEGLVLFDGESNGTAKLLAGKGVFYMGTMNIRGRRIKSLARRESKKKDDVPVRTVTLRERRPRAETSTAP